MEGRDTRANLAGPRLVRQIFWSRKHEVKGELRDGGQSGGSPDTFKKNECVLRSVGADRASSVEKTWRHVPLCCESGIHQTGASDILLPIRPSVNSCF